MVLEGTNSSIPPDAYEEVIKEMETGFSQQYNTQWEDNEHKL